MKAILEFNLPEEQEEFDAAVNGGVCKDMLDEVWQQCFRPLYKFGYSDPKLQALLDGEHGDTIADAIEMIAAIYTSAVHDR